MLGRPHDAAALLRECAQCGARKQSVCSVVEDEDLARLAVHSQHMVVQPGQAFIAQDEPADEFFIVTGGQVKLFTLMADGRRQITGFARQGSFLGLAAQERYAFTAEALTEVHLCRFTHVGMKLLIAQFPALEQRLLLEAARELILAQEHMVLLGRKTALERLASFIMQRVEDCGGQPEITLPMTRTDIADYLGLTIETVSRMLNMLRRDGLIEVKHITRIRVIDRPALAIRAAGERSGVLM
ncbi:Crp/Fnr family transcriptional regulator [Acidomonas methanolica]|uniref:Transcriptional regulator cAMP-binding AadR/Crp/Fnr n=1 Tax=Acidomonas methanolica NBRC 104435 TaxID=1231351 RepID=A0A023D155_ACIMT|nr:helix-turn-helix domain-containing protein [Acidomonas methanolica]TCS26295.1 CRP/FNR family transcriptional regulator [Acidomonas methanolica]GAJ27789.1 transcriptional regulator cAMP-binding AadR/Crp/Fnr [Acidomonas methanolica NBRC 104435]GBQ50036.1 cAMP-binding transcriptional regulator [Acidomonas methanolica]GEK99174.1 transcriptional regulator [Acidomonas methanolica NBRC 104435]